MTSRRNSSDGVVVALGCILVALYLAAFIWVAYEFWTNYQNDDTHEMMFFGTVLVILICGGSSARR